jgi:hypothetical protein
MIVQAGNEAMQDAPMTDKTMSDIQLKSIIDQQERLAIGYYTGEISSEQAKALDYYSNVMPADEEGYSQAQSSDVWDVVEGMTPQVLKPFVSSDEIMAFMPEGAEDVEAAEQETDYINYVVTQKNNIFEQLTMWVKTGLLQKNGIVKYWWDKTKTTTTETYDGLSDEELAMLMQDAGSSVEIVGHSEYEADINGEMVRLHDVKVKVTSENGHASYCVVPPEEFLISRDAVSPDPKKAFFIQHRQKLTLSKIREMGYEVDKTDIDLGTADGSLSLQAQARYKSEELDIGYSDSLDDSMMETVYRETFLLVDYDGDGIAELRKVCMAGNRILANEETDDVPFCAWTPYIQPFKFYGRCPADEVIEIQEIKTTLLRQNLNNIYTINNNRTFISDKVNVDDMINNALAGIIRVDKGEDNIGAHVFTAPIQPLGQVIQPQIEYWDTAKENRTGFTRYNQGLDANSLNKTATGIRLITENANQKVELIARSFAETGLKQLMLGIHKLCRQNSTKEEVVRLRNKWVTLDPRGWKTRLDMRVSVGLGNSDKQMQMQGVQMLLTSQQLGAPLGIVKPENVYAALAKQAEVLGFKDYQKYFSDPAQNQPAPPPDPMTLPENVFKSRELDIKEKELELKAFEVQEKDKDRDFNSMQARVDNLFKMHELEKGEREVQAVTETENRTDAIINAMSLNMQAIQESLLMQNQLSQNLMQLLAAPKKIILDEDGMPIGTQVDFQSMSEAE